MKFFILKLISANEECFSDLVAGYLTAKTLTIPLFAQSHHNQLIVICPLMKHPPAKK